MKILLALVLPMDAFCGLDDGTEREEKKKKKALVAKTLAVDIHPPQNSRYNCSASAQKTSLMARASLGGTAKTHVSVGYNRTK